MEQQDFDDMVDLIEDKKWKVKREVSIGDLIAICSAIVAVFIAWSTLNTRLSLTEQAVATQKAVDDRQDADSLRFQAQVQVTLERINVKLDRLIERPR